MRKRKLSINSRKNVEKSKKSWKGPAINRRRRCSGGNLWEAREVPTEPAQKKIQVYARYITSYSSIIPGILGPRGTTRLWINHTAPNKKRWKKHTQKKKMTTLGIEPRTRDGHWVKALFDYLFIVFHDINLTCIYTYEYSYMDNWDFWPKKRRQHPSQGDDASTV